MTVLGGTSAGNYTGTITVSSNEGYSDTIALDVTVTAIAVDTTPPIVLLEAPAPDYTDNDGTVVFEYNVNDSESAISSCSLIIDGSTDQTDPTITEGITQNFNKSGMTDGSYTWDVNCTSSVPLTGTSGENRAFTVSIPTGPQTILLWAQNGSGGNASLNISGAADDSASSTANGTMYGYTYDTSSISGTIDQVEIVWSHSVPGALNDDSVTLKYGISSLGTVKNTYNSGNTPVDKQGTLETDWEIIDVTSDRSWITADISNLQIGGTYTKSKGPDSSWNLDAAGVRVTYTP